MAWGTIDTENNILQGFRSLVHLPPDGSRTHFQVERTDGGTTDAMIVKVFASLDDSTWDDADGPIYERRVEVDAEPISFVVAGFYALRVGPENAASSPTDAIAITLRRKFDNM